MKIYLASKSPRRRELLAQMEIPFELLLVDTPEIIAPEENLRLSSSKLSVIVQLGISKCPKFR